MSNSKKVALDKIQEALEGNEKSIEQNAKQIEKNNNLNRYRKIKKQLPTTRFLKKISQKEKQQFKPKPGQLWHEDCLKETGYTKEQIQEHPRPKEEDLLSAITSNNIRTLKFIQEIKKVKKEIKYQEKEEEKQTQKTNTKKKKFDFTEDAKCKNCICSFKQEGLYRCSNNPESTTDKDHTCEDFQLDDNKFWNIEPEQDTETESIAKLKEDVDMFLNQKKPDTDYACEITAQHFMKNNKTYCIRDDRSDEVWIYKDGIYVPDGMTYIKEFTRCIFASKYSPFYANKIIARIQADSYIAKEELFEIKNMYEIPVMNGILNIKENRLYSFSPDKIFFSKLKIIYNPSKKINHIKKFFKSILTDDDDIKIIQELFGYTLVKDYSIQKAFMLLGSGSNGKCLEKDSKILMADGSQKNVQDIKIGDKVISPQINGSITYEKVTAIHNHYEKECYEIIRQKDQKKIYICSAKHKIPIIRKYTKRTSKDDSTPRTSEFKTFNYTAKNLSQKNNIKSDYCTFTTPEIEYENPTTPDINPYCLGIWLGDGSFSYIQTEKQIKKSLRLSSPNKEIIESFKKSYPQEITNDYQKEHNKSKDYNITLRGKFAKQLTKLKLQGKKSHDKFIPKSCFLATKEYRWQLLAGLIDTDGFIDKNGAIYYTTKSKTLAENIKNLVFSLGGRCESRKVIKSCQNNFTGKYTELSIQFQNKTRIPLKVPFKKNRLKDIKNNPVKFSIIAKKAKPQQVYGFEITGQSKWHIVNEWYVTHNSAILKLITEFIGAENCANISIQKLEQNDFAASELFNKHVNMAGDISSRTIEETDTFKSITGGDRIAANRKFMTPIYFKNHAKFINSCNELPKSKDLSEGFWRRWILLKFNQKFVPKHEYENMNHQEQKKVKIENPEIIENIKSPEEMSGLLNFAIEGLNRLLKNKSFSNSKSSSDTRIEWIRTSNTFAAFCMDCIEQDTSSMIPKQTLQEAYSRYCIQHEAKAETDRSIFYFLTQHWKCWSEQIVIKDENNPSRILEKPRVWHGIRFKKEVKTPLPYKYDNMVRSYIYSDDWKDRYGNPEELNF